MKLSDTFWKEYELDLQEVKLSYLNWAIGYAKEPKPEYRQLFLWGHQKEFCIINSRLGRSFSHSFGVGVRGVPRMKSKGIPRGLDEIDVTLKARLANNTGRIRSSIANIETGTKKQTDYLAGFWADKFDIIEGHESTPASVIQKK